MMAEGHRHRRRAASLTAPSTVAASGQFGNTPAQQSTQLLSHFVGEVHGLRAPAFLAAREDF